LTLFSLCPEKYFKSGKKIFTFPPARQQFFGKKIKFEQGILKKNNQNSKKF
jgi:hypothetical protein